MEQRKLEEIEFHNRREQDRLAAVDEEEFIKQYPNKRFYAINRGPRDATSEWMRDNCGPGSVVLDYCCGLGKTSIELAANGATVHGIDISDQEIGTAQETAAEAGLDNVTFHVMDAENMDFEDDTFDAIVCSGVLHHLDLSKAYPELARVLKPTGKIIAIEAQGTNPLINLYRKRTPHLRTAWEAEHILSLAQVDEARAFFRRVDIRFFHLATLLAIPFRRTPIFTLLLGILERVDSVLLRIPFLQKMAWQMLFVLSDPKPKKVTDG